MMMLPNVEFVDKWNPRYNIKKQFEVGKLKLSHTDSIKEFSQKYILKEEIIKNSIYHLQQLQVNKEKKASNKKQRVTEEMNKNMKKLTGLPITGTTP